MSEEKKGPSKKELKKLAKKAQKDAAKANAKQGKSAAGSAAPSTNNKAAPPSPPVYRLANIPSSLEAALSDSCTIKACLASLLFNQKLLPGSVGSSPLPFVHGPALLYGDVADSSPPTVAFGGNGILKALSGKSVSSTVDEWLEFERTELRPALVMNSGNNKNAKKKIDAALEKISAALDVHGVSVVGDAPLSVADVAITVTLLLSSTVAALPSKIQTYVNITRNSAEYNQVKSLLKSLIPPSTSGHTTYIQSTINLDGI